jgi:small-conductance mechanosensitive channel
MGGRRVRQSIPLAANASPAQLRSLATAIEELLAGDGAIAGESRFCAVSDFSAGTIRLQVSYFTVPTDTEGHMRTRHRINCAILELIHRQGIDISSPMAPRGRNESSAAHVPSPDSPSTFSSAHLTHGH